MILYSLCKYFNFSGSARAGEVARPEIGLRDVSRVEFLAVANLNSSACLDPVSGSALETIFMYKNSDALVLGVHFSIHPCGYAVFADVAALSVFAGATTL